MDFGKELEQMRVNYEEKPLERIDLKRPFWMEDSDELCVTYEEKDQLVKNGRLCWACVVQANTMLFRRFPAWDCPAMLLYSTEREVCGNPWILRETAERIFSYKDVPLEEVPEQWREMARSVSDELERSVFSFYVTDANGMRLKLYCNTNMIHRRYLPGKKLTSALLPVLAMPDKCRSVVILPPSYWAATFLKAWKKGQL